MYIVSLKTWEFYLPMSVGNRSPMFDTGVLPLKWLGNCGTCLYPQPGYYLVSSSATERLRQKTGRWQLKKMTLKIAL